MISRILPALALLFSTVDGRGAESHSVLLDERFVAPPQQHAAWTCPKGVPERLEQAATRLFELGYADPRGLEYKTATLWIHPWEPVSVHAWLFTGSNGHRYAVTWNGMVYAVDKEGGPADLEGDMAAVIEKDDRTLAEESARHLKMVEEREKAGEGPYPFPQTSWSRIFPYRRAYSHEELRFNMPLMLLRFGRTELAVKLWTRWLDVPDKSLNLEAKASDMLVHDWLKAWKDRAGQAHFIRDDKVALASLRLIEKTVQTMDWRSRPQGAAEPYGHEALLADQERRQHEREVKGIPVGDWERVKKLPVEQRTAELIRWLDDADKETIAEIKRQVLELGMVALESLLVEFVREQRQTRVWHEYIMSNGNESCLDFVPVWEILRDLASTIAGLPHGTFDAKERALRHAGNSESEIRKQMVAFFREEASKNKDLSLADIAWRHLNNNDPVLWAPAAETLSRGLEHSYLDDPKPYTERTRKEVEALGGWRFGDKYRHQTKPSMAELMQQRADELEKKLMRHEADVLRNAKTAWGE